MRLSIARGSSSLSGCLGNGRPTRIQLKATGNIAASTLGEGPRVGSIKASLSSPVGSPACWCFRLRGVGSIAVKRTRNQLTALTSVFPTLPCLHEAGGQTRLWQPCRHTMRAWVQAVAQARGATQGSSQSAQPPGETAGRKPGVTRGSSPHPEAAASSRQPYSPVTGHRRARRACQARRGPGWRR